MNKLLLVLCALLLVLAPGTVMAKKQDKGEAKGPSPNESAYEHASDNAKFKRGDDWQGGQGKEKHGEDLEAEDDGEKGHLHREKEQEREREKEREKKQQGKQDDDESDDDESGQAGKQKSKQPGKGKGKK